MAIAFPQSALRNGPETAVSAPDFAWAALLEALLRGVSHALSNRVSALSALVELASAPASPVASPEDEPLARLAAPEVARLHEVNRLLKLLPPEPHAREEALILDDVIADAVRLMALHPDGGAPEWSIELQGHVPPVRSVRAPLLRALLLMLEVARREAQRSNRPGLASITVTSDAEASLVSVLIPLSEASGKEEQVLLVSVAALAERCQARTERVRGGIELLLPMLPHETT